MSVDEAVAWQRAGWWAVSYASRDYVPTLVLVFNDCEAATSVFATWKERIVGIDEDDSLRISIIDGPIPGEPFGHSVGLQIGEHGSWLRVGKAPAAARVLNTFLDRYRSLGIFALVAAQRSLTMPGNVDIHAPSAIVKRHLHVRGIKDITDPHDPDAGVLALHDTIDRSLAS